MLQGNYNLSMNTPMGLITGKLELKVSGTIVYGTLETMGMKNEIAGGKLISEDECTFSGDFRTPLGAIKYDIQGKLKNEELDIVANTSKGQFSIKGKRV